MNYVLRGILFIALSAALIAFSACAAAPGPSAPEAGGGSVFPAAQPSSETPSSETPSSETPPSDAPPADPTLPPAAEQPATRSSPTDGAAALRAASEGAQTVDPSTPLPEEPAPSDETARLAPAESAPANVGAPAAEPDFEAESEPPGTNEPVPSKPESSADTVRLIVVDDESDILLDTFVLWEEGDTVMDALREAAEENGMDVAARGFKSFAYVEGIDGLYEFDKGPKSGWLYRVNGEFPDVGAGAYKLQAGDVAEWIYTNGETKPANADEGEAP